jgi:phosphoglycerate kinase
MIVRLAINSFGRVASNAVMHASAVTTPRIRPITEIDVSGKTVLVRADLNVPMRSKEVADATRLERILPTIRYLVARKSRVVLLSHLGRPSGRETELSLAPVARRLGDMLREVPVSFVPDCIGKTARERLARMAPGEVAVLENVRFYEGEENDDLEFAGQLAALGQIYVNDAFSCAHRAHSSTHAIARYLPACAGLSMQAELAALAAALEQPKRPVAALVGGAKVSTKLAVLENLIAKVDALVIGGGMANTFLLAQGKAVGKSLAEPALVETARRIMAVAEGRGCEVVLPTDVVVADAFKAGARPAVTSVDGVPADRMILDIGPRSAESLKIRLSRLNTLLWNGPLGAFEIEPFGAATFALARAASELTRAGRLVTVAGGGDTVAALNAAGVTDGFTYVSTAGGAFLEWLEGKTLPGVAALAESATTTTPRH